MTGVLSPVLVLGMLADASPDDIGFAPAALILDSPAKIPPKTLLVPPRIDDVDSDSEYLLFCIQDVLFFDVVFSFNSFDVGGLLLKHAFALCHGPSSTVVLELL